jgi:ABC-type sugar transport system substrate-binding protein
VLLPLQLKLSFADGLSLAGLVVSLGFGMGARALERRTARMRIGIVIPSRAPFHTELRAGLKASLESVRFDVYDDYLTMSRAEERLSEFVPALRRTLAWRPDYVVICSPSVGLLSTEHVLRLLDGFMRRGGGVVFVDSEPDEAARASLSSRYGRVIADVEAGARILATYVAQRTPDDCEVLVLSGPTASEPAEMRRRTFEALLPKAKITVPDTGGWTELAAYDVTKKALSDGSRPRFIVCGNDVMAFGALRALREIKRSHPHASVDAEIVGYDGIPRALYAISDEYSEFVATIATPPSAYGQEIAAMLLDETALWHRGCALRHCCIPVGEGQLVTKSNAKLVIDD